jgi:hypothetical protein
MWPDQLCSKVLFSRREAMTIRLDASAKKGDKFSFFRLCKPGAAAFFRENIPSLSACRILAPESRSLRESGAHRVSGGSVGAGSVVQSVARLA